MVLNGRVLRPAVQGGGHDGAVDDTRLQLPGHPDDGRQIFRIVVDVLAAPAQVDALQEVIGSAICGAPALHPGPCRIAWTMSLATEESIEEGAYGLDGDEAAILREHLGSIDVWPREQVDRSLGLTG